MNTVRIIGFIFLCGILGGCGERHAPYLASGDELNFGVPCTNEAISEKQVSIDEMKPEDFIVVVNGCGLTKGIYDELMMIRAKGVSQQKDINQLVLSKLMEEYRMAYIPQFVAQRLLFDQAFSLNLVTTNDVLSHIEKTINDSAAKKKISPEKFLKRYTKLELKYFLYEIGLSYAMNRLIEKKIPPKHKVDERIVKAVQDQVASDNKYSAKTNEMLKARLNSWKKQILAKNVDFKKLAEVFSQDGMKGDLGVVEKGEMDNPSVEAVAFSLPSGGLSDVIEDDDGLRIVKVCEIMPPEKNEKGRIVVKERRKLQQIYFEKIPLIIRQSDIEMTADLKGQMQTQAINEYVRMLMTNGVNKVIYPNGQKLFK